MTKSIGIDIGSYSIKVVEVTSTSKGLVLSDFIEKKLPIFLGSQPELTVIEFLQELTAKYSNDQAKFIVGLRQSEVSVRLKTFPFHDRLKILKSLPFELEEDLPLTSETAVFDGKVVRYRGALADILAVAAPKNRIEATLNTLKDSQLPISILSAEGLALANCFENWSEAPPTIEEAPEIKTIHLHLHIGHTQSLLLVMENGRLIDTRSIGWGGRSLAESLVRKYEIPISDAYKEIQEKAFILLNKDGASYDHITFSDIIATSVKELSKELQISMLQLQSDLQNEVSQIYISGGVSSLINLAPFLTTQLNAPVNIARPLQFFTQVQFDAKAVERISPVALGLALEGVRKPKNPAINLLKDEFAVQNNSLKKFWETWQPTLQFAAILFALFFVYGVLREGFSTTMAEESYNVMKTQAKEVAGLSVRNQNEAGIGRQIRENEKKIKNANELKKIKKMLSTMDVLKKITDSLPPRSSANILVQRVQINDANVSVQGQAANQQEIKLIENALKEMARGNTVRSSTPTATSNGKLFFALNFIVDRGVQK